MKRGGKREIPEELEELVSKFRRVLYLPDPSMLYLTIATYAANRLPGVPIWILLVGPSSAGGTSMLNCLMNLEHTVRVGDATRAGLLSGTAKPKPKQGKDGKETGPYDPRMQGSLLDRIGKFGVMLWQDLTSILTMNPHAQADFLNAMRQVYDGTYDRSTGVDGGYHNSWKGKVGLIGKGTSAVDRALTVSNEMGTRTLYWRIPKPPDADAKAHRALRHSYEFEAKLASAVERYWEECLEKLIEDGHEPSAAEDAIAVAGGELISMGRSSVTRDQRTRQVLDYETEESPRAVKQLGWILVALKLMGLKEQTRRRMITKVILDSFPRLRGNMIRSLLKAGPAGSGFRDIVTNMADLQEVSESTQREALHDLRIHGLLSVAGDKGQIWKLSTRAVELLSTVGVIE